MAAAAARRQLKPPEYMSYDGDWFRNPRNAELVGTGKTDDVAWLPFDYDEGGKNRVPRRGEPFEDDDEKVGLHKSELAALSQV